MPVKSTRHIFRLLLLAVIAISFGIWGCDQADDIVGGASMTELHLAPERLPSTPPGMVYELWVANSTDTVSLGQFGYNNDVKRLVTPSGATRPDSNRFVLDDDVMAYDQMFISVELANSTPGGSPGPIMLLDDITEAGDNPVQLIFPQKEDSLGLAIVRYNLQSTSDDSRGQDGYGLWFSSYRESDFDVPDTTALRIIVSRSPRAYLIEREKVDTIIDCSSSPCETTYDTFLDTTFINSTGQDTLEAEEVFIKVPWDTSNVHLDSVRISFSPDTLTLGAVPGWHYFMDFQIDSAIDYATPYEFAEFTYQFTEQPANLPLDIFSQDEFDLPFYGDMGWKYKGWVVLPHLANDVDTRLTPPAWFDVPDNRRYMPGYGGALLTTGTFGRVNEADDANPYVLGSVVPPFPGEDFLNATAMMAEYGIAEANLLPAPTDNVGAVFITLEPDNFPYDTTNFPLVVFSRELPFSRQFLINPLQQYTMRNWTQTNPAGDLIGMPKITVNFERF